MPTPKEVLAALDEFDQQMSYTPPEASMALVSDKLNDNELPLLRSGVFWEITCGELRPALDRFRAKWQAAADREAGVKPGGKEG